MNATKSAVAALPADLLERMAATLRVLAHPQRLRIVEVLQGETEAPVHVIVARLASPQAAVSQHLNHMRRSGLLRGVRHGKEVWYSIAEPSATTVLDCIRRKQAKG